MTDEGEAFGVDMSRACVVGDGERWVVFGKAEARGDGAFRTIAELDAEHVFAGIDPQTVLLGRRDRAWVAAVAGWALFLAPWLSGLF